ncbi:MAG: DNA/RNA helicase domain-containing protein [Candidatus Ozemobacteraceae bacterium]
MQRAYYSDTIEIFCKASKEEILGKLSTSNQFALEQTQRDAWLKEIEILQHDLSTYSGTVYFEYAIPRMGRRIDVVILCGPVIFVLEFKVGEKEFPSHAIDQVWDYALDLKNFHESSHDRFIAPLLISTKAAKEDILIETSKQNDKVLLPIKCNELNLRNVLEKVLLFADGETIDAPTWEKGRYCPTPTIIEAAMALYSGHAVEEISRNDASAINLKHTSQAVSEIIQNSKAKSRKSICFVTGVPGAGKTLVGLNIATQHQDRKNDLYSVFLSGNGPLVAVLREALARDKVCRVKEQGGKIKKGETLSEVKMFIQNVHHFRDECLIDQNSPPKEHVALFDEAQRAWNVEQTSKFMQQKKNMPDFHISEPEFLISCLNRHQDWATIICLVGGGQEINTGEAGISEWIDALERGFPDWDVYISPQLIDSEFGAGNILKKLQSKPHTFFHEELHLAVSMRSFRDENVSGFVKALLDLDTKRAMVNLGWSPQEISHGYHSRSGKSETLA